ncbi:uncharacterized protein PHACADRAFT_33019 [Phanerochaete carnosa HHB-10118-sp]|uniref:Uncharacterized protein n=1 Tax=Phanerochaete carnosa (strain HHB-10118-sp) TaxID=650164 RepID=K5VUE5_PHACS|nr:uncharacterized protein PHACADRAFT_33019 [Phanerochaete carnosa HHB-10118-sp]EKM50204.1 hypothetical protein PHACADRAFT_33019 [Phanerochaete carnosa HHB-10118-sp]
MDQANNLPIVTSMIPQPASWKYVRSFKAISGMSDDEKFQLQVRHTQRPVDNGASIAVKAISHQKSLRYLKGKYLDERKLYQEQDDDALKKVTGEACAEFPFLLQRYESAWPIEALLRSRLATSASNSRRMSGQSSHRAAGKARAKKSVARSPARFETQDEEMRDELESSSSPEPEESLHSQYRSRSSRNIAPLIGSEPQKLSLGSPTGLLYSQSRPVQIFGQQNANSDSSFVALPSVPSSSAKHAPSMSQPSCPLPSTSSVQDRDVAVSVNTAPGTSAAGSPQNPSGSPTPVSVEARKRPLSSVRGIDNILAWTSASNSGQGTRHAHCPPEMTGSEAVPSVADPPASGASDTTAVDNSASAMNNDTATVNRGTTIVDRGGEEGEAVVRDFLCSLVQPLDNLLPMFLQAGIQDRASLRGFAALPREEQLNLLRFDLHLNVLQSRIILHGLSQLA